MDKTYITYFLSYLILCVVLGWFIPTSAVAGCLAVTCGVKELTNQSSDGSSDVYSILFGCLGAMLGFVILSI